MSFHLFNSLAQNLAQEVLIGQNRAFPNKYQIFSCKRCIYMQISILGKLYWVNHKKMILLVSITTYGSGLLVNRTYGKKEENYTATR